MATTWKAPTWRMPNEKNQSKFENYSLDFDGTEFIDLGTDTTLELTSDFSVSVWIKESGSLNRGIICCGDRNNGSGWHIYRTSTNKVAFNLYTANSRTATSTTSVNTGNWINVIATFEKNGTANQQIKIYVNNTLEDDNGWISAQTPSYSGTIYKQIAYPYAGANEFLGNISTPVVFDYLLSSDQRSYLYNSGSPINPMTLKPAPIAYYPLGGNASTGGDSSNTLSVPNIAVPDASVFDFNSSSINVGDIDNAGALSFSTWLSTTSTNASSYQNIAWKRNGSTGWFIQYLYGSGTNGKIKFYIFHSNGTGTGSEVTITNLQSGNWFNIALTYDGTDAVGALKLYSNGTEVYSNSSTLGGTGIAVNNDDLYFGGGASSGFFTCKLSNIQLWDAGLSSSNITTLYNNGVPLLTGTQPEEANLKAWYKLDQSANWEADAVSTWQIPDAMSSYPQSFDFGEANAGGEYIDAPTNIGGFTKCSTSVWLNPSSVSARSTIFATNTANNFTAYFWTGNIIYVTVDGAYGYLAAINNYIDANKWNHLSIVYDGTFTDPDAATQNAGRLKMYVNGSYIAFQAISGTIPSSIPVSGSDNIRIGTTSPTTYEFGGELSNFTIYDTNLSASQVETLYNNGVPLTTAIATDNLKGWWKLSDNEKFDGTNWSVENQKYPAGFDSCLDFNGTSSSVNVPAFSDYDNGDLSACIWVNTSDTRTNTDYVFSNSGSSTKAGFDIAINRYGSVKTMRKTRTLTADTGFNVVGLTENTWHHIAFTYEESTNTIKQYFDGQLTETVIGGTRTKAASLQLTIGSYQDTGSFFLGKLSNAAIYNTVLDPATITAIYNNGTPETSISGSPVAWWKLDNLTTGIQDSVGSRNGTNSGATKVNTFVSTEAATSSGMTEQNLVNNNVSALNGESSGMDTSNLVTSTLTRQVPYNSYSLNFDSGSSDYIDCGDADVFSFGDSTSDSPFSISAWVYFDDVSGNRGIISKYGSSGEEWMMYVAGSNIRLLVKDDSVNKSCYAAGGTTLQTGQWYNFLATYDGRGGATAGDGIKIYINGVEETLTVTNNASYVAMENTTQPVEIGRFSTSYMDGKQSNISIFNEELTSTEVLKIYNSGVPGDLSSFNPNPIAWWSLGSDSYFNGSNWICPDLVGSNNGTSSNMDDDALIGDAPNSTANGTSTNMAIDANLTGSAPNSSNNSFSVNMDYTDRETSVPS